MNGLLGDYRQMAGLLGDYDAWAGSLSPYELAMHQATPEEPGLLNTGKAVRQMMKDRVSNPLQQMAQDGMTAVMALNPTMPSIWEMNPETRQAELDFMAMKPGLLGDIAGPVADVNRYMTNPDEWTALDTGLAGLGALPFIPALGGITVYHGSPHKFDKFSLEHIGTGEGAQAYGHGLYFAENQAVANNNYRLNGEARYHRLSGHLSPKAEFAFDALEKGDDLPTVINKMQEYYGDNASFEEISDAIDEAMRLNPGPGYLYEVDIPDEAVANMLDWDAPLSEQPEAFKRLFSNSPDTKNMKGSDLYRRLARTPGFVGDAPRTQNIDNSYSSEHIVSKKLRELGIPGIKYYDGMSRAGGKGTRNFVVFDENLITPISRNDEPMGLLHGDGPIVGSGLLNNDEQSIKRAISSLEGRGIKGDDLLNAQDLLEELKGVNAKINPDGTITAYHRTSKEAAEQIAKTGRMKAKEPAVFFSTSKESEHGAGFGDDFVEVKIPIEQARLDDIFPGKDASISVHAGRIGKEIPVTITNSSIDRNKKSLKGLLDDVSLPMDQASRMKRAKDLGYDITIYHGQDQKNLLFNGPIEKVTPGAGMAEEGALFGADSALANKYAGRSGAVYPLMIRSKDLEKSGFDMPSKEALNAMTQEEIDKLYQDVSDWNSNLPDKKGYVESEIDNAIRKGKEGVVFREMNDPAFYDPLGDFPRDIYATQGPHVRSIFAAFDPKKKDSSDLLAQIAAMSLLGGGLGYGLLPGDSNAKP